MTNAKTNEFRKALEARAADLLRGMRSRGAIAIETSADPLDQIQNAGERDLSVGNLERESKGLRETRAALVRIENGSFGICADCEEEISPRRLAAVPWSVACLDCQEKADRMLNDAWMAGEPQMVEAA